MKFPADTELLSRDDFKRYVFARAGGRCVFCPTPAVDAHHVLDRKLFSDGGYYLGNGAAVCDKHHWQCETTELSLDVVRAAAGIRVPVLPVGLDAKKLYDKWGNELREDGLRIRGPLGSDDGMLRALERGRVRHLLIPAD
ncbi:hypothetical protein KTD31_03095 [Burkholderia multivorans]|uniref:hypothetical protein n=1 Tax=Burkholderia multivorans TaxID=87883 RepID=UPI001C24464F|nr:hypothetical protein [Burkholderia multivorans]MBU9200338.1 hypothetical protein [Burkholderia multivorans]MDN8078536.1 hypothetical protein [Burkholderia multivorans]